MLKGLGFFRWIFGWVVWVWMIFWDRILLNGGRNAWFFLGVIVIGIGVGWIFFKDDLSEVVEEYVEAGDYEGALEEVARAIDGEEGGVYGLKLKGKLYLLMGLKESGEEKSRWIGDSVDIFEEYIELMGLEDWGGDYEVYFYLSYGYFLLGEEHYRKSLVYLVQSIKLRDIEDWEGDWLGVILEGGRFWVNFMGINYEISLDGWAGYMAYRIGDYERGLGFFRRGLGLSEEREGIYYMYMGLCLMRLGLYEEAVERVEKFIEIEEGIEEGIKEEGNGGGIKEGGIKEGGVEVGGNNIEGIGYLLLSQINFEQGNYEEALKDLELARLLKEDVELWYQYGLIYEGIGQIKKAIEYWKKVIKKDKSHGKAMSKLIRYDEKYKYNQKYNRY